MPAWAPSRPCRHDPSVLTTSPSSYSNVSSPRYQMLPPESWAYQSRVSSTTSSPERTTSRTTRARMPSIIVVLRVTLTVICWVPSALVSCQRQIVPGRIGQ